MATTLNELTPEQLRESIQYREEGLVSIAGQKEAIRRIEAYIRRELVEYRAELEQVKPEQPDWLDTPASIEKYRLLLWNDNTGDLSNIVDLTRAEFIELKRHLAKLRGYEVAADAAS